MNLRVDSEMNLRFDSTGEMEPKSIQKRMRLTVDSNGSTFEAILRFEKEYIFQACENFKEARGHSERIIWAQIAERMLFKQMFGILLLIEKICRSSLVPKADSSLMNNPNIEVELLLWKAHDLHRYDPCIYFIFKGKPKSMNLRMYLVRNLVRLLELERLMMKLEYLTGLELLMGLDRLMMGLERLIGNVCKDDFQNSFNFVDQFDPDLPHLPQSMYIQKAIEASERLVRTMLDTPSRFARQQMDVDSMYMNIAHVIFLVLNVYNDMRSTLFWLNKITYLEPKSLVFLDVFLDDYDQKKKLESIMHSNNLWLLTGQVECGYGCVDVQMTVKPVVSESRSCVAMKFGTLWIKPITFGDPCDDLELVTQLNLTFAPLTSHPECVLLVEAEKGSPNSFYDVSVTDGATHSATAKISLAPSSSISYATSTTATIKATTKIWMHSQLLSRDRFYAIPSNFATYQLVCKGGYNSGTYFWKLDGEAEKALPKYLEYLKKPKSGQKCFSIPNPKHGKRIPLLKKLGLPWNELDHSVNFTCEDYPHSIKWYLNNELHRKVTMKWMVKLEIFLVNLNGKTRRAFFWSDSLEIPSTLINEEAGSSSNNVHG